MRSGQGHKVERYFHSTLRQCRVRCSDSPWGDSGEEWRVPRAGALGVSHPTRFFAFHPTRSVPRHPSWVRCRAGEFTRERTAISARLRPCGLFTGEHHKRPLQIGHRSPFVT